VAFVARVLREVGGFGRVRLLVIFEGAAETQCCTFPARAPM
jgi:hypothetical protein